MIPSQSQPLKVNGKVALSGGARRGALRGGLRGEGGVVGGGGRERLIPGPVHLADGDGALGEPRGGRHAALSPVSTRPVTFTAAAGTGRDADFQTGDALLAGDVDQVALDPPLLGAVVLPVLHHALKVYDVDEARDEELAVAIPFLVVGLKVEAGASVVLPPAVDPLVVPLVALVKDHGL